MTKRGIRVIAVLTGFCLFASVLNVFEPYFTGLSPRSRRFLQESDDHPPHQPPVVFSWARSNLRPVAVAPEPTKETVLIWHIPKSGGSVVHAIYQCMGKTLANKDGVDPKHGHGDENNLVTFQPWPGVSKATFINVDTTSKLGINRAKQLGLVPSGFVDGIVTSHLGYAVQNLFDESHKGRVLALFRHPVDRLVSKFFYLQSATWEDQYRPQWKRIGVLEFAKERNTDNNYMVKTMAGLGVNDTPTEKDLRQAKRTIQKRFIVGLMDHMEESVHRFSVVMGIDEADLENRKCTNHFLHNSVGAKRQKTGAHPKVNRGSATWNALAKRNALDISLYEFVVELFAKQKEVIESYEISFAESRPR